MPHCVDMSATQIRMDGGTLASLEVTSRPAAAAFEGTLRSRARDTDPIQWVGVGTDAQGRLIEYIAVENEPDGWLVFHAMMASTKVLKELGLRR